MAGQASKLMREDRLSSFHSNCRWVAFMTLISISITITILIGIIIGATGFANLIIPFILRGCIVGAWGLGLIIIIIGIAAGNVKRRETVKFISTVLTVLCMIQVIMILVAGIDVTKTVFSPATLVGKVGDLMSHGLANSKHMPASLRGGQGELLTKMIGRVGASIIAVQMIGILPFPYNVILFFIYYRFLTVLVVCVIPVLFASLAAYKANASRSKPRKAPPKTSSDESVREYVASSDSESDRNKLLRQGPVTATIARQPTLEQNSGLLAR